jgi:hypothetical protein
MPPWLEALLRQLSGAAPATQPTPAPTAAPTSTGSPAKPWEAGGGYTAPGVQPKLSPEMVAAAVRPPNMAPLKGSAGDPAVNPGYTAGQVGSSAIDDELLRKLLATYAAAGTPGGAAPPQRLPR